MPVRYLMSGSVMNSDNEYSNALRLLIKYMNNNITEFARLGDGLSIVLDIEEFNQTVIGGETNYNVICRLQRPISIGHERVYVPGDIMEKMFRQDKIERIIQLLKVSS